MELSRDKDGYCIKLTQEPPRGGHRPAVDVLFESLVPFKELQRHAVIMTGMGSDGAKGMEALAKSGAASTIAEAEETCVVYGMPRCAVENGSAQAVVPLQQIAPSLVHNVSK
jgi:two-component system chemotaxis response regulator CheB